MIWLLKLLGCNLSGYHVLTLFASAPPLDQFWALCLIPECKTGICVENFAFPLIHLNSAVSSKNKFESFRNWCVCCHTPRRCRFVFYIGTTLYVHSPRRQVVMLGMKSISIRRKLYLLLLATDDHLLITKQVFLRRICRYSGAMKF